MCICQVCNIKESVIVACVPGVPMSAAYCQSCVDNQVHPLDILAAICGGLDEMDKEWKTMVTVSLDYFHKDNNWFNEKVKNMLQICHTSKF